MILVWIAAFKLTEAATAVSCCLNGTIRPVRPRAAKLCPELSRRSVPAPPVLPERD